MDQEPLHTVLVVDDDPSVRKTLARLLERQGFEVLTTGGGAAALELVRSEAPDLVLLDVVMPGMGGLEVCRRLKGDPETRLIPVVLVTGLEGRSDRLAGIEAGADDFLSKPVDPAEMVARIRSLLRVKRYTDELERVESVLMTLARTVEERDAYTRGHCDRLANMSAELGRRLGLATGQIVDLERGGYLHDIGKVVVPDAILNKPGPLTSQEWARVREHPVAGERICSELRSLRTVLPIIRHHHERLDGSGYPDGLAGDAVPMTARVLQVVDVYDALTTQRPYKPGLAVGDALQIMEDEVGRGWRDPAVFAELVRMVEADDTPADR